MQKLKILYLVDIMKLSTLLLLILLLSSIEPRRRRFGGRGIGSGKGISILGKGIASLAKTIKNGDEASEDLILSGKEVDEPVNTFKMHE